MAYLNQFIFPINDFKVEIPAYRFDPYAYYLNIYNDNVNYTHPYKNSSTLAALPPPPPVQKGLVKEPQGYGITLMKKCMRKMVSGSGEPDGELARWRSQHTVNDQELVFPFRY
jgi:hypothetical protein